MTLDENWKAHNFETIVELYSSVNWTNYTKNPTELKAALENSSVVTLAVEDQKIIGLSRSITDNVSIHYLQDILVHPDHQKNGVGRALLEHTLNKLNHVRTHMLLTDDEERQHQFYQSLGYKSTSQLTTHKLHAFVKMKDIELK